MSDSGGGGDNDPANCWVGPKWIGVHAAYHTNVSRVNMILILFLL